MGSTGAEQRDLPATKRAVLTKCRRTDGEDLSKPGQSFHLGYRRWLDGLRGLAILLVLAFHLRLVRGGSLGVDVFFVLSGFLITTLLVEEWQQHASISLRRFYGRRALRLVPAFFTLLAFCYLYALFFRSADELHAYRREMIVAACYVANWPALHQTPMTVLGHTWSLSVEEQFYLLWPLALYAMLRFRLARRRILGVVCLGILAATVIRGGLYVAHRCQRMPGVDDGSFTLRLYMGLDTRADALLAGCLAGLLASWNLLPSSQRFRFWTGVASLVSAAALACMVLTRDLAHHHNYYGMFALYALMTAIILIRLLQGPIRFVSPWLESGSLVYIGRISYALNLFHIPIIHWLAPAGLGWGFPAQTVAAAGLTFVAAALSYSCIERPFLRFKQRLQTARSSARTPMDVAPRALAPPAMSPKAAA